MAYKRKTKSAETNDSTVQIPVRTSPFAFLTEDEEKYIAKLISFYNEKLKTPDEGRLNGGGFQGLLELGYNSSQSWVKPFKLFLHKAPKTDPDYNTIQSIIIAHGYVSLHKVRL